jgi:hypothetical protein
MFIDISNRFLFRDGVIFARFQANGNFCSLYQTFSKVEMGEANISAYFFKTQFAIPSGPGALSEFNDFNFLHEYRLRRGHINM